MIGRVVKSVATGGARRAFAADAKIMSKRS